MQKRPLKKDVQNVQLQCRLLSMGGSARYLGISYHSLRRMVIAGTIPCIKFPSPKSGEKNAFRRPLLDIKDLDQWIESCRINKAV